MTDTRNDTAHAFGLPTEEDESATQVETRYDALALQLLDATDLDRLPALEPLIEDILDRRTVNWLHGKPGSGKSFVAIDLTCHVASGQPWRGHAVRAGHVLYVAAEGAYGMRRRLRAWEIGNHAEIVRGTITFLPVAVQMNNDVDLAALHRIVDELQPTLIVIDTQAKVTLGMDENAAREMGPFIEHAEDLSRVCGSCVLLVHHEARAGDNLRGSSSMEGAGGTIMRVEREGRGVKVICKKQKEDEEFPDIAGSLVSSGQSAYYSKDPVGVLAAMGDNANRVYQAMLEVFRSTGASSSTLIKHTGLSESSFHYARQTLVDQGVLRNDGSKARSLWVLTNPDEALPDS